MSSTPTISLDIGRLGRKQNTPAVRLVIPSCTVITQKQNVGCDRVFQSEVKGFGEVVKARVGYGYN